MMSIIKALEEVGGNVSGLGFCEEYRWEDLNEAEWESTKPLVGAIVLEHKCLAAIGSSLGQIAAQVDKYGGYNGLPLLHLQVVDRRSGAVDHYALHVVAKKLTRRGDDLVEE